MKVLNYRILLRKEPEGGYTVIVPSLAGCVTYGKDIDDAIKMAKEAIGLYLESLKAHARLKSYPLKLSFRRNPFQCLAQVQKGFIPSAKKDSF